MASRPSAIPGSSQSSHRLSAASGVAFTVLLLASVAAYGIDIPTYDDTGRTFAAYYSENAGDIKLSVFLGAFSVAAFVWFAALLRWVFANPEIEARGVTRATDIGFAAAIAAAAASLVTLMAQEAAVVASGTVEHGVIRTLDLLGDYAFVIAGLVLGIWLISSFFIVRVTKVLPDWLGWLAAAGAVLAVLQSTLLLAPQNDDGPLGVLGIVFLAVLIVWVAAASLTLMRRLDATTG